ncbi:uncharacterized protein LOC124926026 [Impatiens glandulifera]|uniref:uncharacterized protein LOC124926026 n=1 Tax=Impatiens glandulifera TaxID=253017 RepID=UPI001FB08774|nr:uncharacterized protein LOC124926026 [Impatiens glandulifera]XP_047322138.1 uncharacterized protein LOC124926026 [Impatiens glandulifera]
MLLALEGGGFFSSSSSGYRKGLSVLLLGRKRKNEEEKLMRVSPWNHNYQLVDDREAESDLQLASKKNRRFVRGCTSFVCFGRTAAGLESPNSLKVGPTKQKEDIVSEPPPVQTKDVVVVVGSEEEDALTKPCLKSSLKRPVTGAGTDQHEEALDLRHNEKRKVQWTDASGGELAEIREFELSDADGSDDEFNNGRVRSCSCTIM